MTEEVSVDANVAALETQVLASLAKIRNAIEHYSSELENPAEIKEIGLGGLVPAVRKAVDCEPLNEAGLVYGYETAATIWPTTYVERSFGGDVVTPCKVFIFVCMSGGKFVMGIDWTDSRNATPGTVFSSLAPWREKLKAKTKQKKIDAWCAEDDKITGDRAVLEKWAESVAERFEVADTDEVENHNPPSDKQLNFIESLRLELGFQEDEDFASVLKKHTGVDHIDSVARNKASPLIEALIEMKKSKGKVKKMPAIKMAWSGKVLAIEPRVKLAREYDERVHNYAGFSLYLDGKMGEETRAFTVGIGKAAQAKHGFRIGDTASGMGTTVPNPAAETTELYKASKLKREAGPDQEASEPPPFVGLPPAIDEYSQRGSRRLLQVVYEEACRGCYWASRMPVDMTKGRRSVDRRFETFCFGPKSCFFYDAGPARTRMKRGGGMEPEPDSVEEADTAHRD